MVALTASGAVLENTVESLFKKKGFETVKYRIWEKDPSSYGTELVLKDVPYTTIYGHKGKTEFLIKSKKYNLDLRIECKWQQVPGSVDEKLPYLYLNAIETMPEEHFVLLIDGEGWKKGAIQWFRDAVAGRKYIVPNNKKIMDVMSIAEFISWANDIFKHPVGVSDASKSSLSAKV